jgi:hypothetical protein
MNYSIRLRELFLLVGCVALVFTIWSQPNQPKLESTKSEFELAAGEKCTIVVVKAEGLPAACELQYRLDNGRWTTVTGFPARKRAESSIVLFVRKSVTDDGDQKNSRTLITLQSGNKTFVSDLQIPGHDYGTTYGSAHLSGLSRDGILFEVTLRPGQAIQTHTFRLAYSIAK